MNTLTDRQRDRAGDGAHERMNEAWQWLCEQRDAAPQDADVWHLRWQQLTEGPSHLTDLVHRLLRGGYRLSPLQLCGRGEQRKAVWGAQDALVLKWVALSLQSQLPLHASCEHIAGHGGGRQSIERLHGLLTTTDPERQADPEKKTEQESATATSRTYRWVCRTDIRGYYRNINKATLLSQVKRHVSAPVLCDLVEQYLHYTVEDGGTFHTPEKGISRGCSLSPLMGALHLYDMDEHFSRQKGIHYARYMDDVIILAKSRWQLRKHTKRLMQWFSDCGFEAHPDKTQIGRTEKGFDWMGAWLTHEGVKDSAPRAKANHREKVRRLYERLARVPLWARKRERQRINARVSTYRKRWTIWAGALLAVSACAHADGPVVVVASGNVAGDTGVRFATSGVVSGELWASDHGGICLSATRSYCGMERGFYEAVSWGGGWGLVASTRAAYAGVLADLILMPHGSIRLNCSACGADTVSSLDPGNGNAVTKDGRHYQACEPVKGNSSNRGAYTTAAITSRCPYDTNIVVYPERANATVAYDIVFAVIASKPLSPGDGGLPDLYVGAFTGSGELAGRVSIPNKIIVSGLNCNLVSDKVAYDLGDTYQSVTQRPQTNSAAFGLSITCAGTNSSDEASTMKMGIEFDTGAGYTATDDYKITAANQPGFYGTVNTGNTPSCTKGLKINTADTSGPSVTYRPNATGRTDTLNYSFGLCSTGKPQNPGAYEYKVTARLVNY